MTDRTIDAVFEVGGINGIALAGAAAGTMEAGYSMERVAGASAGALVASIVVAGYTSAEIATAIGEIDWATLQDPPFLTRIPGIGKHLSMMTRQGMYLGDELERVWHDLLARKGIVTFGDLPPGVLKIVVTDLTHARGVVLPDDLPVYGMDPHRFEVARAVRMSSTVPFVFRPVRLIDRITGEEVLFADGGMATKFPMRVLHETTQRRIVGFRLINTEKPHPHLAVRGPISLAEAVISAGLSARETLPGSYLDLDADYVLVPGCRDPMDFDVSPLEARRMFEEGRKAALRSFRSEALEAVG
jgi:NTE family protein